MKIEVIDNFLPEKEFGGLQSYMMNSDCPWFYQEDGTLNHLFYSAKGQLPSDIRSYYGKVGCRSTI